MKTNLIMKVMNVIFWIILVGLCIKTGAILTSFLVSIFVNPEAAKDLYLGFDLFNIYELGLSSYVKVVSFLIVLTGMKAYLAFLAVKLFMKFDLDHPFNKNVTDVISKIGYFALSIGIVALVADDYTEGIVKRGADISQLDWGAHEFLFFAGIIYILALVFKRGVEMQEENQLTI
ncbi:DUF2975 domain-containing protein [Aequorivita capsosiphonis]|uniref:DUF2975 domain-containing protein n=1 Tax=Aequorivita capsosiphonis TaxID=487317 RepID=UPI00047B0D96|nr:DUF2975 domain-containing protein [Aequorivita capsosiphonis]